MLRSICYVLHIEYLIYSENTSLVTVIHWNECEGFWENKGVTLEQVMDSYFVFC